MAIFLQYLPQLIAAANSIPTIMEYIEKMKANFKARGEWTQEADEAFTAELANWHPVV